MIAGWQHELLLARTGAAVEKIVAREAAAVLAASGAVIVDAGGQVRRVVGLDAHSAGALAAAVAARSPFPPGVTSAEELVAVAGEQLVVAVPVDPATPLPDSEQLFVLGTLVAVAELALDRAELIERERAARADLHEREQQLRHAQQLARLGSYEWDVATGRCIWSAQLYSVLGYQSEQVAASVDSFMARVHPADRGTVESAMRRAREGDEVSVEHRLLLPGGEVRHVRATARRVHDREAVVGVVQDETDRVRFLEQLTHQESHDGLTGLANRALLTDRLAATMAAAPSVTTGVLFLDVDRLKWVNDSRGHASGDELLRAVARRLRAAVRPGDTVARFGGDEFVVLCPRVSGAEEMERIAERVTASVRAPLQLAGSDIVPTVSVGIAISSPGSQETAEELLRDADAAMYVAKERGRDRRVLFDPVLRERVDGRLEVEQMLRAELQAGAIEVHYQPQIDLQSGMLVGMEALARLSGPDGRLISPSAFIPVAEDTGLIVPLGTAVLREACAFAAALPEVAGAPPLSISVNLSPHQLLAPGVVELVRGILAATRLEPARLVLEITEGVLLREEDDSRRVLGALSALGARIAVDDFGTGYSSLAYLKRFPVDHLKIDRTFVRELGAGRPEDRTIVASIIDLAHAFGLTTVAEGIECLPQLAELNLLGCAHGQGYLWSRPLPAAAMLQFVGAHLPAGRREERPAGATVVLVDDDAVLRTVVRGIVEGSGGCTVVGEAEDGRAAVAMCRRHQPDVVLLDLAMPGLGGVDAIPLLRAVAPRTKIVILSALDAAAGGATAASASAAYVPKHDLNRLAEHLGFAPA